MKQEITLDITPNVHLIAAQARTDISYAEGLAEFVDNAFDAGAVNVSIDCGEALTVKDDGSGCPDLQVMLTLGGHRRTQTTRLGMYGVGAKNAAQGLGQLLSISTVCDHVRR